MSAAGSLVMAARCADEHQRHQPRAEQDGKADAEGGGNDQAGVHLAGAARDQHDRDCRNDDRQQREQAENPPEAAHRRLARARQRVRLRHGFPLAVRSGTIKATSRESGRKTMTIASVLRDKGVAVETVTADTIVHDAVGRLGDQRIGALPVVEDGRIAGIVSERDVIYRLREHGPEMLAWPVSRIMSSPAITSSPDMDVLAALALMTQRRIRHLPVVAGGEIRGIVSIGDLVKQDRKSTRLNSS